MDMKLTFRELAAEGAVTLYIPLTTANSTFPSTFPHFSATSSSQYLRSRLFLSEFSGSPALSQNELQGGELGYQREEGGRGRGGSRSAGRNKVR